MAGTSLPQDQLKRIEQICQQAAERRVGADLSGSTDAVRILDAAYDQSGSDPMLLENFR